MVQLFKKKSGGSGQDKDKKKIKKSHSGRSRRERSKKTSTELSPLSTPPQNTLESPLRTESSSLQHEITVEPIKEENIIPDDEPTEDEKVIINLPVICRAEAICDYNAENMEHVDDEVTFLHFSKEDVVDVVEQDDSGWWEGIANGEWGIFPGSYVKVTEIYQIVENSELKEESTETATGSSKTSKNRVKTSTKLNEKDCNETEKPCQIHVHIEKKDKFEESQQSKKNKDQQELEYLRKYKIEKEREMEELLKKYNNLQVEINKYKLSEEKLKEDNHRDPEEKISSLPKESQNLNSVNDQVEDLLLRNKELEEKMKERNAKILELEKMNKILMDGSASNAKSTTYEINEKNMGGNSNSTANQNISRTTNVTKSRPRGNVVNIGKPRTGGNGNTEKSAQAKSNVTVSSIAGSDNSKLRTGTAFSRPLGPQGKPIPRKLITTPHPTK